MNLKKLKLSLSIGTAAVTHEFGISLDDSELTNQELSELLSEMMLKSFNEKPEMFTGMLCSLFEQRKPRSSR